MNSCPVYERCKLIDQWVRGIHLDFGKMIEFDRYVGLVDVIFPALSILIWKCWMHYDADAKRVSKKLEYGEGRDIFDCCNNLKAVLFMNFIRAAIRTISPVLLVFNSPSNLLYRFFEYKWVFLNYSRLGWGEQVLHRLNAIVL